MAISKLRVEIRDPVSPLPRAYEVSLEMGEQVVGQIVVIDPKTGFGAADLGLTGPGKGRLTIEKPPVLAFSRLPAAPVSNIALEDVYEYNVAVVGGTGSLQ